MHVVNQTQGTILAQRLFLADTYLSRLRGLIGHAALPDGSALWINPCQQVHTHFMKYPLDVVFLDGEQMVLRVVNGLAPWRVSPWVRHAKTVLEFNANGMLAVSAGDQLRFSRT